MELCWSSLWNHGLCCDDSSLAYNIVCLLENTGMNHGILFFACIYLYCLYIILVDSECVTKYGSAVGYIMLVMWVSNYLLTYCFCWSVYYVILVLYKKCT